MRHPTLRMEPRWEPKHVRGPPRGACPRERQPLCPLAATLGFNAQRAAPSYAVHRRPCQKQTANWASDALSELKLRGAGARGLRARFLRPRKPRRAADPAWGVWTAGRPGWLWGVSVCPSFPMVALRRPPEVRTRSGALCSPPPECRRALLWLLTALRWLQVASGRGAPLVQRFLHVPEGGRAQSLRLSPTPDACPLWFVPRPQRQA